MLWIILVILLVLWLGGFLIDVAGNLIHLLLVIALIVLIYQFVTGRRAA
ncbi:MAG: lmo0937 family membrane protein [Chloroflexota bacterium]|nr:lmo0937 family membrane protein [Chloroflexota bacterium]